MIMITNNIHTLGAVAVPLSTDTELKHKEFDLEWLNITQCSGREKSLIDCPATVLEYKFPQVCSRLAGVKCASREGTYIYT